MITGIDSLEPIILKIKLFIQEKDYFYEHF